MDVTYNRNPIWTTNNGYLNERPRPRTPGNLSIRTTISNETEETINRPPSIANNTNITKNPHQFLSSHFVGVQSRFRRKYYHKFVQTVLILLIVILFIVIIILATKYKKSREICRTHECLRTAASLLYSMNDGIDPCEDFYQFTCGNWPNEHPRPDSATSNDWFRESQLRVIRRVRQFLQSNVSDNEPEAVGKAKHMYRSCMDIEMLDRIQLEPIVHLLREFQLPLIPSILNITLSPASDFKNETRGEFNWLRSLVYIKKFLGMDLIIGFDVYPDPLNRTINRIAFGTPETEAVLPFNNDDPHKKLQRIRKKMILNHQDQDDSNSDERDREKSEEEAKETSRGLTAYVTYVKKIVEHYMEYLDPEADDSETGDGSSEEATLQAIKVARKIYKFKAEAENSTKPSKNPSEDIVYLSIPELQNQTDKLIAPKSLPIWQEYLSLLMANVNLTKPFSSKDLKILTSSADVLYLQNIVEYLHKTESGYIEFFIWLSVVEELILHTTSDIRALHSQYLSLVTGTEGSTPRSLYCAHTVNSLVGMAVSYTLADENFSVHKLPKVRNMLSYIRQSFTRLVMSTSWMDERTKRETLQKSAEMKSYIGYPEWILNATELNLFYAAVNVNESTYLLNMVEVLRWEMQEKLNNFYKPEPFGWATSPSNVNAFHTFQSNAITIPIAILQYPFYDLGLEALNYGSVGTILGHELTHGFDDSGRMFDKNGNMVQWWSNETIKEYINRTECFVDQYSQYHLTDINEYIDGELTLGENIADNGGMREAFYAYRLFVKNEGREKLRLPGMEKYDHEQLFFISFGNLWCESYTPAASRYALEDSHCPGKIRLQGVLANSEEFAMAFECPSGSKMNPKKPKCKIW